MSNILDMLLTISMAAMQTTQLAQLVQLEYLIKQYDRPILVVGRCRDETGSFFPSLKFPEEMTPIYLAKYPMNGANPDILADFDDFNFIKQIPKGKLEMIWFDWSTFKFFTNAKRDFTVFLILLSKTLTEGGKIYLPFPENTVGLHDDSNVSINGKPTTWKQVLDNIISDAPETMSVAEKLFKFDLSGYTMPSFNVLGDYQIFSHYYKMTNPKVGLLYVHYVKELFKSMTELKIVSSVIYNPSGHYEFVTEIATCPGSTEKRELKFGYFVFTK